jgi:FkbM family methyltransferase
MRIIKELISKLLLSLGFSIRRTSSLTVIESLARTRNLLGLLEDSPRTSKLPLAVAIDIVDKAKSQLGQDVLALTTVGTERGGFFVEFGATNGFDLSNTFILEKNFGWSGILCEPARGWHVELRRNRSCSIDTRCVYSSSGQKIQFSETSIGELSGITSFMRSEPRRFLSDKSATYDVDTITLNDLLVEYDAPEYIDFLSIDTEGSEYEILRNFDFSMYSFGLICVEHNFTENRGNLKSLLVSHGYTQVYSEVSAWDDWYIRV